MRSRPRWCAGTPRVGRRGALKSPEPPRTYGAQSWLERPNPVGRRVADARWAGRDAHLTAARPIVREFVFLRLPKRSRRARLHDRVRENGHPAEGVGGKLQARRKSPDPHGPLQAPKIFRLSGKFVVAWRQPRRAARRDFRMEPSHRKLGWKKAAKTHRLRHRPGRAAGQRDARRESFPHALPLGTSRKFP